MANTVRASGISCGYPRRKVLSDFDISLGPGLTGLLGPNGAGKTTLLKALATVAPPTSGDLYVCGDKVSNSTALRQARGKIGYLPQDFRYHANFTVREFVHYAAWLRIVRGDQKAKVAEAIHLAGLTDRSSSKMKALSGGMLQRAGIAAAIVGRPPVIILDEPTVGLDPAQRLQFRNLLGELEESAVVLSTHLIEDVAAVCDQVAVMVEGSLKFHGTVEALADLGSDELPGFSKTERGYMSLLESDGAA